jgi:predicted aspartyl protease
MLRLRSSTIGCVLVALCFISQPASLARAEYGALPGGVVTRADSAAAASAGAGGTRLAQSGKRADAQGGGENWKRMGETVVSGGDEPTKVRIRGNTVLVPVTLSHGGYETEVHLVLDTGASRTTISTDIADQLSVNLGKERKARVQVVGGAVIEARVVRMNHLIVGPHTKRNWDVFVVPHKGPASGYGGLLGMDVLRGLKYRVDFSRQLIIWE